MIDIFNKIHDVIYRTNVEGELVWVTPSIERLLGYKIEEILGLKLADTYPDPKGRGKFLKALKDQGGFVKNYETQIKKNDGSVIWVSTNAHYYRDEDGKILGIEGAVRDITERKNIEEVLRHSEEKYRMLAENIQDGIFLAKDGKFTFVNEPLAQMLGYTAEEVIGTGLIDYIAPEFKKQVIDFHIRRLAGEDVPEEYETCGVHKDGKTKVWVNIHAGTIKFFGEPTVIGTVKNITVRKNAEEKVKASYNFLQTLVDTIPNPVFYKNAEGVYTGCNKAFEEWVGKPCEQIIGTTVYDVASRNVADKSHRMDMDLLEKGGSQVYESSVQLSDGRREAIINKARFMNPDGSVGGLVGIILDITELKKVEHELREAKEEAEKATSLKDKFVSLVSHDLKSPVATILGLLKLLQRGDLPNKDLARIITNASAVCERMTALIDDLLNIGRIKTGKLEPKSSFIDACYLTLKAMENYRLQAEKKGVKMESIVPEQSRIFGDEALLQQVMLNLISNAVKFSKNGDRITIRLKEDNPTTIIVEDTGLGIDEKRHESIFNYEEKTSTQGTEGETGSGLGLPLARDIMMAHGGRLIVESEKSKGSTFHISLPVVKPVVLIVDDDELIRTEQICRLEDVDVTVLEAENGREALEMVKDNQPHLIITDINMPEIDGLALLSAIRKNPETENIPVIVVTGERGPDIRTRVFNMGANDFVNKPLDPDSFISRVRRFVV